MRGARGRDRAVDRPAGDPGVREPENTEAAAREGAGLRSAADADADADAHADADGDERGAAAEAGAPGVGEPARTGSPVVLAPADPTPADPAKADPTPADPVATDPVVTAESVAADPVAVADPVAPAPGTPASAPAPAAAPVPVPAADDRDTDRPLMAPSERDELGDRLHRATGRFVDDPPGAVDDACAVLDDLGERIAALLAERRDAYRDTTRTARTTEGAASAETERLRLTLRDCRDLAERLLKL